MIIHCSRKLAAKLPDVSVNSLQETSPLGSWHGHLYSLDRRQCVMFCHDASRCVLFLPGMRKEHFAVLGEKWFRPLYLATLTAAGRPDVIIRKADLALGPVRYDTATDRSVRGSLSVAKQDLEAWLYRVPNVMDLDPIAVSIGLNERPVTIRGQWIYPAKVMREMVEAL
jgi:hypothetical protein